MPSAAQTTDLANHGPHVRIGSMPPWRALAEREPAKHAALRLAMEVENSE